MSIQFALANSVTQADYNASSVYDNGATIPVINKPALAPVATAGTYASLTGKPTLATVATTGAYTDLTAKPSIPTAVDYTAVSSSGTTLAVSNKPSIPTTVDYTAVSSSGTTLAVTNKPTLPTAADYNATTSTATTLAINNKPTSAQPVSTVGNTLMTYGNNQNYNVVNLTLPGASGVVGLANTQSQWVYVHGWYNCASPVTFVAGEARLDNGNNGSQLATWDFIDPSKGFVNGNMYVVTNRYVGFWSAIGNAPTYENLQYVNSSNRSYQINAITLPAGKHEFRLASYSFNNIVNSNGGVFQFANFSNALPFLNITDYQSSGAMIQNSGINTNGNLTAQKLLLRSTAFMTPGYWKYNLTTAQTLTANVSFVPPSSAYSLVAPTGSPTIMNTAGVITIPQTGIYALSLTGYYATSAATTTYVFCNDRAIQSPIYSTSAPGSALPMVQSGTWIGRLAFSSTLTPNFLSVVANQIISTSVITGITITQICLCA